MKRFVLERSGKCSHTIALARYIVKARGEQVGWAASYIMAELGNLLMVLLNMYLTDIFLRKEFSTFGPKVLNLIELDPETRDDPMTKVFPRITKCTISTFGPSGSVVVYDALCVLSSNIMNEKIFTFLWFW